MRRKQQMEVVQMMNHHVRNALQVVSFCAHSTQDRSERMMIRSACDRVEWSLATVLPMCAEEELHGLQPARDIAWRDFPARQAESRHRSRLNEAMDQHGAC